MTYTGQLAEISGDFDDQGDQGGYDDNLVIGYFCDNQEWMKGTLVSATKWKSTSVDDIKKNGFCVALVGSDESKTSCMEHIIQNEGLFKIDDEDPDIISFHRWETPVCPIAMVLWNYWKASGDTDKLDEFKLYSCEELINRLA